MASIPSVIVAGRYEPAHRARHSLLGDGSVVLAVPGSRVAKPRGASRRRAWESRSRTGDQIPVLRVRVDELGDEPALRDHVLPACPHVVEGELDEARGVPVTAVARLGTIDAAVVGEPTNLEFAIAQRGLMMGSSGSTPKNPTSTTR